MKSFAKNFDRYLKELYVPKREVMIKLKDAILEIAPESKVIMNWGMPTFTYKGESYLAIAAHGNFFSIYIWTFDWKKELKSMIKNINTGKICIRFKKLETIPNELLRELVIRSLPKEF